ncbi:MAG: hypothetical protein JO166_07435 [Deltaproteobacteria bacterium]|nr:hypothetical protein [Deltaproteobacteria bacterium]
MIFVNFSLLVGQPGLLSRQAFASLGELAARYLPLVLQAISVIFDHSARHQDRSTPAATIYRGDIPDVVKAGVRTTLLRQTDWPYTLVVACD